VLEVTSISKTFAGFKAVNKANLTVEKGEIVAVIGPNGAGKTTLFNLITGIIKPDSGRVLFKNEDITGFSPHEVCRKRISRSFQIVNVFQRLTVFENVQISVLSREKKTWNLFTPSTSLAIKETDEILASVGLLKKKNRTTALLSHGDRKVLEIAMALGGSPEFLILDEPTRGIDVGTKVEIQKLVLKLAEDGVSVTFISSEIEEMLRTCSRLIVMKDREIVGELSGMNLTQSDVMHVIARGGV